jgi:hypothetical protein
LGGTDFGINQDTPNDSRVWLLGIESAITEVDRTLNERKRQHAAGKGPQDATYRIDCMATALRVLQDAARITYFETGQN